MVRSVLVYSMGEVIGDGLIKLPFAAAVRAAFPAAHFAWCAAKVGTVYDGPLKPVVAGVIDEVISSGVTGAGLADFALLRRPFGGRRFDVVIDTQTNVRRSLVARRGARLFISPAADFRLSHRRPEVWPEAMVDRLTTLLELASGRPVGFRPAPLVDPHARAAAEALLPPGPRYVGFAPGAGGAVKRWPLDRYIALAAGEAEAGRTPVFFLGPDEVEDAAAVRAALPGVLIPELDRTDPFPDVRGPLLAIALAGRLAAAVANDAGPGHMLAAGGAPLLSLQLERRKAVKFHPSAVRLEMLIAEDFDPAAGISAIPLDAARASLDKLLAEGGAWPS